MSREKFPEKVKLFLCIHIAKYTIAFSFGLCQLWMKLFELRVILTFVLLLCRFHSGLPECL